LWGYPPEKIRELVILMKTFRAAAISIVPGY
jgi:hypothetical protein